MDDFFVMLLLLALLICFVSIIGFIVKWITKKPKKKWGIFALSAFVSFWAITIVWGIVSPSHSENNDNKQSETIIEETDNKQSETTQTEATPSGSPVAEEIVGETIDELMPETKSETDPFVEKLLSFGFTENEAIENAKILKQCGIPTIDICKPVSEESIDNLVAFRGVMDDNRTIWFTVENRKIFYISLNGEDLYDEDKGGYLKNFNDVHIPETNVSVAIADTLRNKSEAVLDDYFTYSPYYDAWAYGREDNNYMVQCQATDGSVLTSNWINCRVWFEQQSNGEFTVTGVQINGKQYKLK